MKLSHYCQQAVVLLFSLMAGSFSLPGQQVEQFFRAEATQSAGINEVTSKLGGGSWASIRYRGQISLGGSVFMGVENDDAVLVSWGEALAVTPRLHLRGPNKTYLGPMAEDSNGQLYFGGSFWATSQLNEIELEATAGSRALLLGQLSEDGTIAWLQQIEGTGLKEITAVVAHDMGVYIGGYFSENLQIDGQEWTTPPGFQEGFVAHLLTNGQLDWLTVLPGMEVAVEGLVRLPDGGLVAAGNFLGSLMAPSDTIETQTADEDGFIAGFDSQGNWERLLQLGGVQRDIIQAIAVNPEGVILIGGDIVGTLFLPNGEQLASMNGLPDLFFIELDEDWSVQWAGTGGGALTEELAGLVWHNDHWWASGNSSGDWTWDAFNFSGDGGVDGFVMALDGNGESTEGITLRSDDQLFVNTLAASPGDYPQVAGSFRGMTNFPSLGDAPEVFTGFWLQLKKGPSSVSTIFDETHVSVWPNPSDGQFWVETEQAGVCRWYDAQGKLLKESWLNRGRHRVALASPAGGLFWQFTAQDGRVKTGRVVVK